MEKESSPLARQIQAYMEGESQCFRFSHEYFDEAIENGKVYVYVSVRAPDAKGMPTDASVTLSICLATCSVYLAPPTASPRFQAIAQGVFELMCEARDLNRDRWMMHNYLNHVKRREAEYMATFERLDQRIRDLQTQLRTVSDEHNAWVVQQQLEAGIDPDAHRKRESFLQNLIDIEENAQLETDLRDDADEAADPTGERPLKRAKTTPTKDGDV
jgi:hypothetical protein